ncbi:MAG: zinc-ribbon domain-containing protein [Kordiimonadaceae bacterium]|nr:zinc-ribbon domain-containing protein [Kordiimonadaceae bacterium]
MILACPSCDAKFKIPDGAIPAGGRTVRCATCKNSWHAKPADIVRKQAPRPVARHGVRVGPRPATASAPRPVGKHHNVDDPAAAAAAGAIRQSVRAQLADDAPVHTSTEDDLFEDGDGDAKPAAGGALGDDDFIANLAKVGAVAEDFDDDPLDDGLDDDDLGDDEDDYDEDDFLTRRRAGQRKQNAREASRRREMLMNISWGGLVVFWLVTFSMFMLAEEWMNKNFPGATHFVHNMFEGTSDIERFQPEPGEKLTPSAAKAEVYISAKLDNLRTRLEEVDGKNILIVRGFVENLGTTGAHVPKVLVEIVDEKNRVLDKWVTEPIGRLIRRRGKVNFETSRDVPPGMASVRVSVIKGSKSTKEGIYPS